MTASATASATTSGLRENDVLRIEGFAYLPAAVVDIGNPGLPSIERVLRFDLLWQRFDRVIAQDTDNFWIAFRARQHVVDQTTNVRHRRRLALHGLERP